MNEQIFLPKSELARIAVERARARVLENKEMVIRLKSDSHIEAQDPLNDPFMSAENFYPEDSYAFDLYKIKSKNGISHFLKDIFGVS